MRCRVGLLHLCTDDQQQKDRQAEADQKAKEKEGEENLSYEQLRAASYKPKEPSNSGAGSKYTVAEEGAAGKGEKDKAVSVDVPVRLPPLNASVRVPPPLPLPRLPSAVAQYCPCRKLAQCPCLSCRRVP
jgi:hypothetical protein